MARMALEEPMDLAELEPVEHTAREESAQEARTALAVPMEVERAVAHSTLATLAVEAA